MNGVPACFSHRSFRLFTWISEGTDRRPTIVVIELYDRAGQTELVLTHRGLPSAQIDGHTQGWTDIARKLENELRVE